MTMFIKEVSEFTGLDENGKQVRKSRLVITDNGVDTQIILEGNGKLRVTTSASL